jgi:outer membrane murein-binding lipoprotein Lpp
MRAAVALVLAVLVLAGCASAAPHHQAASHASTSPPAVQHPANGCWTVARPYVATLADDLAKQAKLIHRIVKGNPAMRHFALSAAAGAWLGQGIYAPDLQPFDEFGGFTCNSGSIEDTKYPSEAQFDLHFNLLLNDISALQNSNGSVTHYLDMRRDVHAVEADYQA